MDERAYVSPTIYDISPRFPVDPENEDLCYFCGDAVGEIISCDGMCRRAFCLRCLELDKIPQGEFYCPECASGRLRCIYCNRLGVAAPLELYEDLELCTERRAYQMGGYVFRCCADLCSVAFHLSCAYPYVGTGLRALIVNYQLGPRTAFLCERHSGSARRHCFRCLHSSNTLPGRPWFRLPDSSAYFCERCAALYRTLPAPLARFFPHGPELKEWRGVFGLWDASAVLEPSPTPQGVQRARDTGKRHS